ncbi:MAG TPA: hypothetical protein VIF12_04255, partial [Micavibrio sp.]
PLSLRTEGGREEKFLYATPYLAKALAFAFSYHDLEILCNGGIDGSAGEFAVVTGGEKTLQAPRHIRVFAFSDDGFEQTCDERQFVSTRPVPFSKTKLVLETTDISEFMRHGLQIFLLEQPGCDLVQNDFMDRFYGAHSEMLLRLMKKDNARWINQERGINPSVLLANDFRRLSARFPHPAP